jgi:hypothetical protein
VYIVGGKPRIQEPEVGLWKSWQNMNYPRTANLPGGGTERVLVA